MLLNMFASKFIEDAEAKPEAAPALDLKHALEIHHVLNDKLQKVLEGNKDVNLDVALVSQDHLCTIGKWLYGEGKSLYAHLPEYESMRKVHAELHSCAGEVLAEHQIGNIDYAEVLFKTKFRTVSNKNKMEFTRLFRAANR
ncbi:MAG: CZB domain-containing protein [Methylotenera sp.]